MRKIKELAQQQGGAKASKAGGGKSRDAERVGGGGAVGEAGARKPGSRDSQPGGKASEGARASEYSPKMDMVQVRPTLKELRDLQVR